MVEGKGEYVSMCVGRTLFLLGLIPVQRPTKSTKSAKLTVL